MASLVLGIAGAAVGSMFGAPQLGYAIGSLIGSALSAGGDGQHETVVGPRLSDLKVQNSTYGVDVPTVFNTSRLAGNIIWSTEIVETRSENTTSSGGGKGGGGGGNSVTQVSYTYAANLAVAICAGPITRIKKIWANSQLIFDVDVNPTPPSTMTFYLGTEVQTPNSFIQSLNGSTYTSAFRGTAYVVFSGYQLATHGNAIPNFEFEVETAGGTLGNIVSLICQSAGLVPGQIDVTALTDTVDGYRISNRGTGRQALEPLSKVFFFDCVESSGIVKFVKRGNPTPAAVLTEDDLDARASGTEPGDLLQLSRKMELELPYEIAILFPNTNDAHQQGTQYERRLTTKSRIQIKVEAPVSMPDSKAKEVVTKLLHDEWTSRNKYAFSISRKYTFLEPTDPIVVVKDSISHALRIIKKDESKPGIIRIEAASEDAALWSYTGSTVVDVPSPPVYYVSDPGNTAPPVIFDAPKTFAPEGNELIIAACGASMVDWGGCRVWLSLDGLTFAPIGIIRGASSMGVATTALPLVADPDTTSTLGVNMTKSEREIESVSVEAYDAAVSLCYIDGEMIAFKDALLTSAHNYNLTTLHRGLFNSTPGAHLTAVDFVKIDSSVFKYPYPNERIGDTVHIRLTSFNKHLLAEQSHASVANYTYTLAGTSVAPAAANISGLAAFASANAIFVEWTNPGDVSKIKWIEIWRSDVNDVTDASSFCAYTANTVVGFFSDYIGSGGVAKYYFARTINLDNVPSAFTASVTATTGTISATPPPGSIVHSMMAADSIWAGNIKAGEIVATHLAAGTITASEIAANTITSSQIANGTITSTQIAGGTITATQIAASTITAAKIAAGTLTATEMSAGAITAGKIAANAISAAGGEIADLAVTTLKIAGNAVTLPVAAYTSGEVTGAAGGTWTSAQSVTIAVGSGESVMVSSACGLNNGNTATFPRVRIRRDSTTIFGTLDSASSPTGVLYQGNPVANTFFGGAWSVIDTPGAGTFTYYLQFATHHGSIAPIANLRSMSAVVMKR